MLRVKAAMAKRGLNAAELGEIRGEVGRMGEEDYRHHGVIDYVEKSAVIFCP